MATYKYQQNYYEGASAGYVKYNVTHDFGRGGRPDRQRSLYPRMV